jgi:hypothetical protein
LSSGHPALASAAARIRMSDDARRGRMDRMTRPPRRLLRTSKVQIGDRESRCYKRNRQTCQ